MQNFAVIEVLPNVVATEPVTSYFLIVKFVIGSGFEAGPWELQLQSVQLMSWINKNINDQALTLVYW